MRALGVRVDVIADIDVLNDEAVLQRIVQSLGGNFTDVAADASPLKKAIESHKPWLNAGEVVKGIEAVLDAIPGIGEFPRAARSAIEAIFKKASPWDAIKDAGAAAIPAGTPTNHWSNLQKTCQAMGLWIVPVGESEGFCKSIGGHGPGWAQAVIESRDIANDEELAAARAFIKKLWERG